MSWRLGKAVGNFCNLNNRIKVQVFNVECRPHHGSTPSESTLRPPEPSEASLQGGLLLPWFLARAPLAELPGSGCCESSLAVDSVFLVGPCCLLVYLLEKRVLH